MKRALISVSNKDGIVEFARRLTALGYEIISTGGTFKTLDDNGVPVRGITEITGFPECLDGRLKTLHPKIHGGLLAVRDNREHMEMMFDLGIEMIDVVVVNLYPFKETIKKEGVTLEQAIENIDIGGPAMLRSAAKNYKYVSVVVDPGDYEKILSELEEKGGVSPETGLYLAAKVFNHTAQYDCLIADYLAKLTDTPEYPDALTLTYEKLYNLRYGENPHQSAAFYKEVGRRAGCMTELVQLHGKELSFNNINDTHGALELLREFDEPAVVACKHSNPCGVGIGATLLEAFRKARDADPVSIFGGIVVANGTIEADLAKELSDIKLLDIVLARDFADEALALLSQRKNLRVLKLAGAGGKLSDKAFDIKKVSGGMLIQKVNNQLYDEGELSCVTKREPSESELENMRFAMKLVKHTKSNAITIAKNGQSLGIGCGQMSRIRSCKQAIHHAGEALGADSLKGAALASDAYFPFPDCVEEAYKAGITAIIQPGGSVRDRDSIELCDKYGMTMLFTGMRHFRH